jgi:ankyrin repeat protein
MAKGKLKQNLQRLRKVLIDHPEQNNEALKKEVIKSFLQLSKGEQVDFLSFIQGSTITVNTNERSPNYPLKNILIISMIDSSTDVISTEEQREYLNVLLDAEEIDQELIVGLNTPLERAILRSDLPTIKFLIEGKKAEPVYVFEFLTGLIQVNFNVLYSKQKLRGEDLEKVMNNSGCYNYILQKINLSSLEDVKDAASIVIELSNIIKKAIKAKKDKGSTIEQLLIRDLRQSQDFIEKQVFEVSKNNRDDLIRIRGAILDILKLNDGSIELSNRLILTIVLKDVDRFKQYFASFKGNQNELLKYACRSGSIKIVKYLIEGKGVDVDSASSYGERLLLYACRSGSVKLIKYLVEEKKSDINLANRYGDTILMDMCRNGEVKVVKYLIEQGADVNLIDQYNSTPLLEACRGRKIEIVKYLVEQEANINAVDLYKKTPLTIACTNKDVGIIESLLKTGKVVLEGYAKALKIAKGHPAIEELLIRHKNKYSIYIENAELNYNFTSNIVFKGESSSTVLYR